MQKKQIHIGQFSDIFIQDFKMQRLFFLSLAPLHSGHGMRFIKPEIHFFYLITTCLIILIEDEIDDTFKIERIVRSNAKIFVFT